VLCLEETPDSGAVVGFSGVWSREPTISLQKEECRCSLPEVATSGIWVPADSWGFEETQQLL